MTILFFDTETTGFPVKGASLDDPRQPRIVQFAYTVTTDDGRVLEERSLVVAPWVDDEDYFEIPEQAVAVHGITSEIANTYGYSQHFTVRAFNRLVAIYAPTHLVAHNSSYDMKMLEIAAARYEEKVPVLPIICTMEASRDILKIPPTPRMQAAGFTQYKSPKLEEAYRHFFNEDLSGAHDALVDTRACMKVYFELKKLGVVE